MMFCCKVWLPRTFTLLLLWNTFTLSFIYYSVRDTLNIERTIGNPDNVVLVAPDNAYAYPHSISSEPTDTGNLWRAIVIYEADKEKYARFFQHFLYNSWKYILRVERTYKQKYRLNFSNIIDLIVVIPTDYSLHSALPAECQHIADLSESQKQYLYDKRTRTHSMCIVMDTNNTLHSNAKYTEFLRRYVFLNSIDCVLSFRQQYPELYYQYDYILKTDDDVFLTPFFVYQFPLDANEFIVGRAGYIWPGFNITKDQLMNASSMLGLKHCREPAKLCFNHGSSWYGSPSSVYNVAELTIPTTMFLVWLFDTNQTSVNSWTKGWYRGISSLYASEIAINHLIIHNDSMTLKTFHYNESYIQMDGLSAWAYVVNQKYELVHIHTYNDALQFSKFAWQNNKYDTYFADLYNELASNEWNSDSLAVRDYCMAMAYDLHLNLSVHLFDVDSLLLRSDWV